MLLVKLGPFGHGRIVDRSFRDPSLDQLNLFRFQGRQILRHGCFAVLRADLRDQVTLLDVSRHDRGVPRLAPLHQPSRVRHHVLATLLRRLMTAVTRYLKNRPDFLVVADLLRRVGPRGRLLVGDHHRSHDHQESEYQPLNVRERSLHDSLPVKW
jgi:hypothetical protein